MNEASTNKEPQMHSEEISPEEVRRALERQEAIIQAYMENPEFKAAYSSYQENPVDYMRVFRNKDQGIIPDSPPTFYESAVIVPVLEQALVLDCSSPLHLLLDKNLPIDLQRLILDYCKQSPEQAAYWKLPVIDLDGKPDAETGQTAREVFAQKVSNFLSRTFSYNSPIAVSIALAITMKLYEVKKVTCEIAHWHTVINATLDEIGVVAPNLLPISLDLKDQILIFKPRYRPSASTSEWNTKNILLENIIAFTTLFGAANAYTPARAICPPRIAIEDGEEKATFEKILTLHEISHLILNEIYDGTDSGDPEIFPDMQKRHAIHMANLQSVLDEAVALTFEMCYMRKQLENQEIPESQRNAISVLFELRQTILTEALKLWSNNARRAFIGNTASNSVPSQMSVLPYGEGARWANHLGRQGWTLNDLPELVRQAKQVLFETIGSTDRETFQSIPVEKATGNGPSQYQLVKKRILALKPSSPDDQRTRLIQTT